MNTFPVQLTNEQYKSGEFFTTSSGDLWFILPNGKPLFLECGYSEHFNNCKSENIGTIESRMVPDSLGSLSSLKGLVLPVSTWEHEGYGYLDLDLLSEGEIQFL